MKTRKRRVTRIFGRVLGTMVGAVFLAVGLGGSVQAAEKVGFQNYWVVTPNVGPYFTALEHGYYKAEGLDVDFPVGKGSAHAIQMVGAGKMDIGISDFGAMSLAISRGVRIKGFFCYLQRSPLGVITQTKANIRSPKDLEGTRLAFAPADSGWLLFPVFASINGVNMKKITLVSAQPSARDKLLLTNEVDASVSYPATGVPLLRAQGGDVASMRYADYNVNALGAGLMATEKTLKERAGMIRKFVRASTRGFKQSMANPEETVTILTKRAPLTIKNRDTAMQILMSGLGDLHTKRSKGKSIGWMAKEDWKDTLALLSKVGKLKKVLPVNSYFTNDFIAMK